MMKTTTYIFALLIGICLFACTKSKKEVIAKQWKATELKLAGNPVSPDDLGGVTYTFKADGTYEFKMGSDADKGKWTLNEDGTKLSLTSASGQTFEKDVKELTEDKMTISGEEHTMQREVTLVPAK